MGRIKEVLAELDNGAEVVVTEWGMTFGEDALRPSYHITTNDIEQAMNVIRYLRETRPFARLEDITGVHAQIEIPDLKTLPEVAVAPGGRKR